VQLQLVGTARSLRDGVLPLTFRASGTYVTAIAVGQPVTVVAQLREQVKGVVVPAQAIVRNPANEPVVWIKSGAERFIPQPVQYRVLDGQTVVVTQGLAPDNRIVVQGASLIAQIR
jgi:membrane fusion protein, heavy metal efflux system